MNLTIKNKLVAGFVLISLLLFSAILFVTNQLSESNDRTDYLITVPVKRIELSNEILIGTLQVTRFEKNMVFEKDPIKRNGYHEKINTYITLVETNMHELNAISDDKGKNILEQFKPVWNSYRKQLDDIVRFSANNDTESAYKISTGPAFEVRESVNAIMEQIISQNQKSMLAHKIASDEAYSNALQLIIFLIIVSLITAILVSYWITEGIAKRITFISGEAEKIASREFSNETLKDKTNDELQPIFNSLISINESFKEVTVNTSQVAAGDLSIDIRPRSDRDLLGNALKKMLRSLREKTAENEQHNWLTSGQNQLNEKLRGDKNIEEQARQAIGFLCSYTNASIGALYLLSEQSNVLELTGQYAFPSGENSEASFMMGQGLIGQAALEKKQLRVSDIREHDLRITSSLVNAQPKYLLITPFVFQGETLGVIEMGKLIPFTETELEFINASVEIIAICMDSAIKRKKIQELLEETQKQSEELQSQQEELRQINEELEEQTQNLKQQQEELQMTNEELEEQTQALEMKNKEVEAARNDIEQKTKQLEISSRYKSEFLANMSHELRTPLNSLLILSNDLAENRKKNLSPQQVESAEIINKSGHDLLALINEVLDLSKIEAGKMTVNIERVPLKEFANEISRNFKHQANRKGLQLTITIADELPEAIKTDRQRLDQIVKNLMSNALKFTSEGRITVSMDKHAEDTIAISVTDTGIGIPEEKRLAIFEAFQQADGGTSRKYGGTGLGLSISRELARLLGGELQLKSKLNSGSTFTLLIPYEIQETESVKMLSPKDSSESEVKVFGKRTEFFNYPTLEDDRKIIQENDKIILIIEDDLKFADILLKQAHGKGFKVLSAATGEDGLVLAEKYKPHAIILDIDLPGMDGHQVLTEIKSDPLIRHIPVHIISINDRSIDPIKEGALSFLTKPVDKQQLEGAFNRIENFINRKMKNLLIIEDDTNARKAMQTLIGNGDVNCYEAGTGKEAMTIFKDNHIDCIVLDIGLPDINGIELIHKLEELKKEMPPIIVYTGKELSKEENNELQKYTEAVIIKGTKSEERLLDETALFLHRTIDSLPDSQQRIINKLYDKEIIYTNKKILLVDDDMRNVFALSKILKERNMEVIKADNGINALEALKKQPDIDLVLMDIMMPEMDGYEAMRRIRTQEKFNKLPIIALTAKAMKDDKQKCIDAGANDYITKPVDVERLLSLMRVWLSK